MGAGAAGSGTDADADAGVALQWPALARFGLLYAGATVGVLAAVPLAIGLPHRLPLFAATLVAAIGGFLALSSFRGREEPVDPRRRRLLRRALAYCAGVFAFAWAALLTLG